MYPRSSATIASAFAVFTWPRSRLRQVGNSGDNDGASGNQRRHQRQPGRAAVPAAGSGGNSAMPHPGSGGQSGGAPGGRRVASDSVAEAAARRRRRAAERRHDAGKRRTAATPTDGREPAMPAAMTTPGPARRPARSLRSPMRGQRVRSPVTTMPGGPSGMATVLYPRDLGKDGLKHPIVVWDNGAGQTGLSIYGDLLNHIASHGFAVYAAYSATDQGTELTEGLDWMIAQNDKSDSPFYQKLDPTMTAAMGHSQGSIATFAIAADPRLKTTLHLSGGTNPDIARRPRDARQPASPRRVPVRRAGRRRPGRGRHRIRVVPLRLPAHRRAGVPGSGHRREPHQRARHDDRRVRRMVALAS